MKSESPPRKPISDCVLYRPPKLIVVVFITRELPLVPGKVVQKNYAWNDMLKLCLMKHQG